MDDLTEKYKPRPLPEILEELRKRKTQMPLTGYDKLVRDIEDAPISFLPALLLKIVETCVKKKVFASKESMKLVIERQMERIK